MGKHDLGQSRIMQEQIPVELRDELFRFILFLVTSHVKGIQ